MSSNNIYSKEWCNAVFEGKNKAYGAYPLRTGSARRHRRVVAFLLLAVFALAGLPSLILFLWSLSHPKDFTVVADLLKIDEGVVIKEANLDPRLKAQSPGETARQETIEETADTETPETERNPRIDWGEVLRGTPVGTQSVELELSPLDTLRYDPLLDEATGNEQITGELINYIPQFPGGIVALMRWLDKTTIYPPACIRSRIEGTVKIAFIVLPDGNITGATVDEPAHRYLNEESLRVVRQMPAWEPKPGAPFRKPVRVTLPFTFQLN